MRRAPGEAAQRQPLLEAAFGVLGAEHVLGFGHAADDHRQARVDDQHLEPLRRLGHDLGPVHIEQVVELVEHDQFDAAVFEQPGGAVGQTLHRAAAPGGITQGQEQIGGNALGPGIGLQGDLEDRLTVGRVGLAGGCRRQ